MLVFNQPANIQKRWLNHSSNTQQAPSHQQTVFQQPCSNFLATFQQLFSGYLAPSCWFLSNNLETNEQLFSKYLSSIRQQVATVQQPVSKHVAPRQEIFPISQQLFSSYLASVSTLVVSNYLAVLQVLSGDLIAIRQLRSINSAAMQ